MGSTELEIVNDALGLAGRRPVSSLTENVNASTSMAVNALRKTRLKVLSSGWSFNRVYGEVFSPDSAGHIKVADDILDIDEINAGSGDDVVRQNGKLYNATKNTYVFDSDVECDVIYDKTVEQLPEMALQLVAAELAVRLISSLNPKSPALQTAKEERAEFRDLLMAREVESFDESEFDSRATSPALNRYSR